MPIVSRKFDNGQYEFIKNIKKNSPNDVMQKTGPMDAA